ncbi:hypothetical protein [Nitrosomonas sp. Nm58]|uniref:hypothetical protein n=1 Tax=Nitrosomonas sp. Nm58 TaxID=200126 RepID=UPI0008992DBF|nr:hypothetical protein [Nitrosomonas sp. Nm58]SDY18414.1 hypothetical protein SAMN05421754_100329 [Nitrosomonas sp. Nm58]
MNHKSGSNAIGTDERIISGVNGWVILAILLLLLLFALFLVAMPGGPAKLIVGALLLAGTLFCWKGLFTLEPNQAAVMIFFGSYTHRTSKLGINNSSQREKAG